MNNAIASEAIDEAGAAQNIVREVVSVVIGNTGTLQLSSGAAATQALSFGGTAGVLDLASPSAYHAPISLFGGSDTIDLLQANFTTFAVTNDTLTVKDGATTVATLDFVGSYTTASFSLTEIAHNVVIAYA